MDIAIEELSFEAALKELEGIVARLEARGVRRIILPDAA